MIPFAKAHAYGNDFLIVREAHAGDRPRDELARRLCNRNRGVGADGVEFLSRESSRGGRIRLYNADGSIAEISGNGTRCAAAWIADENGAGPGDEIALETDAGLRLCRIAERRDHCFHIVSPMGVPEVRSHSLTLAGGGKIDGAVVSTGNPHFVILADSPDFRTQACAWQSMGEEICAHPEFPWRTNVEFVHRRSPSAIDIRIYERGVGPTTSSGTGTCAAAAASIRLWGAERRLAVCAPGGMQTVDWPEDRSEMILTGSSEILCRGEAF